MEEKKLSNDVGKGFFKTWSTNQSNEMALFHFQFGLPLLFGLIYHWQETGNSETGISVNGK